MKKAKPVTHPVRRPIQLGKRELVEVTGGRLDNAPINVVSDYNPDGH